MRNGPIRRRAPKDTVRVFQSTLDGSSGSIGGPKALLPGTMAGCAVILPDTPRFVDDFGIERIVFRLLLQ